MEVKEKKKSKKKNEKKKLFTWARGILNTEKIQLCSQLPVVSPRGFCFQLPVGFQLFLRRPRRAVDPLELRLGLVPSPVGPRDGLEVERVRVDVSRRGDVGSRTEIPPRIFTTGLADVVDGDGCGRIFRRNPFEDLFLERFTGGVDAARGLLERDFFANKGHLGLDDPLHFFFDQREVGVCQGGCCGRGGRRRARRSGFVFSRRRPRARGRRKVVVEPALDPGPDRGLRSRLQPLDRHRHNVGTLLVFFKEREENE